MDSANSHFSESKLLKEGLHVWKKSDERCSVPSYIAIEILKHQAKVVVNSREKIAIPPYPLYDESSVMQQS